MKEAYDTPPLGEYSGLIWITNNINYALRYARHGRPNVVDSKPKNGRIYVYRLSGSLNIFNAYSKKDVSALEDAIGQPISAEGLQDLQEIDWEYGFRDSPFQDRRGLIETIREMGEYDGVFNYEYYKKANNNPAIGLFSPESLTMVETFLCSELNRSRRLQQFLSESIAIANVDEFESHLI